MPLTSKQSKEVEVCTDAVITGTGALVFNIFQLFGSVRVLEQYAEITSVTTLTNATAVYATLYDGTNTVNLTADGAVLSGAPVGTVFTKDQDITQTYSVALADQCRVNETVADKRIGKPFTITQKNGADTYVRFHLTTTDSPVLFAMHLRFVWEPLDGGYLVLI